MLATAAALSLNKKATCGRSCLKSLQRSQPNLFVARFDRLHNETNCGTHRSWSCLECNNFTEEAYKSHMEIHHKLESDEDDAFLFPKVETTLTEGPCDASQSENDIKTPVEVHTSDPLLLAVQTATDPDESSECDPDMSENCTNAIEDYSVNEHKPEM